MGAEKVKWVTIVEDVEEERKRLCSIFEKEGYVAEGFATRQELFDGIAGLKKRQMPLSNAVVTDISTEQDDMKLQNFLQRMDIKFSDIPVFICTTQPGLVHSMGISMPRNTKGVYQRITGMSDLLKELANFTKDKGGVQR